MKYKENFNRDYNWYFKYKDSFTFSGSKDKIILERVGNNCPVTKSLHPDLEVIIIYNW